MQWTKDSLFNKDAETTRHQHAKTNKKRIYTHIFIPFTKINLKKLYPLQNLNHNPKYKTNRKKCLLEYNIEEKSLDDIWYEDEFLYTNPKHDV